MKNKNFPLAATVAFFFILNGCATQIYSETRTLETRPHVTLHLLFEIPEPPSKNILVLFFGENGRANVPNILGRAIPLFLAKGLPVVVVDAAFYSHSSRAKPEHAEDIRKVIEYLGVRGFESIYLVGTSNGTISVAYIGSRLQDEKIKGLVLTGAQSYYITKHAPIERTPYPVLFVHHKYDDCPDNSYDEAVKLSKKYVNSSKVDFVTVNGGKNEQPYPCFDMSYHDFWQRDFEVAQTITDWVFGKEFPREIN